MVKGHWLKYSALIEMQPSEFRACSSICVQLSCGAETILVLLCVKDCFHTAVFMLSPASEFQWKVMLPQGQEHRGATLPCRTVTLGSILVLAFE